MKILADKLDKNQLETQPIHGVTSKLASEGHIHHFHIDPPKFCIAIVFDFSWDDCDTQEKLDTMVYAKFWEDKQGALRSMGLACLHGGGGPQVGEVTRLGGVTRLSIQSLILM